ncbi:MAG: undecaprenyl-diphosphate phosphatase [Gemmataceae bacterium]|nr:undecaprenyl-diphosphate phosphatase [Gemmataceae bacterium]
MTIGEALLLGIVEGLTEYLPVSSTGHLLLTTQLLGLQQTEGHKAFEIAVQAGAILAVIGAYARGIGELARGVVGRSAEGRQIAIRLLIAFAVTSVIGLTLKKVIKEQLFNLWVVAGAWIVGGLAIFIIESWRHHKPGTRSLATMSIGGAILIGLMQAIALCPGVSRSLVTLAGGLLIGLTFSAALEFSFLLGGLTLLAAAGYETVKYWSELRAEIAPAPAAVSLVAATVSAFLCVRWMLKSLEKYGLAPFGWYRIALGLLTIGLLAAQVIQPK